MGKINHKKIIILQDYFLYKGGGERSIITLAKELNADIATTLIAKDAFDPRDYGLKTIKFAEEGFFSHIPGIRHIKVQSSFFLKTKFLKNYDIIIYSGDCVSAIYNAKGKLNIAYVHTPPRHLYDNYQKRLSDYGFSKRQLFKIFVRLNRWRFEHAIKKMDILIANSKNIQNRIKKYLGMDSVVAYPPCDTLNFKWLCQKDYYFSWARLYDTKQVDKIVEAFTKMPEKKLIVASGGPELKKIKKIAKDHDNIKILGWISDEKLLELLGDCIATIYIPIREDFGMSPVESMMAGKPTIGVDEGGIKETIIHKKTGILLNPNFNINDIVKAVRELTPDMALKMRFDCETRAKLFSKEKFVNDIKKAIEKIVK